MNQPKFSTTAVARRLAYFSLRIASLVLLVGLVWPTAAAAIECPVPLLPRVTTDPLELRAELEAAGLWQVSSNPAMTPPPDPQVGDTWDWYVWDLGGFPVADIKPATVRGMGDHCYVVVDDEEWLGEIDQDDVDRIVAYFDSQSVGQFPEQGIWDLNTGHFGEPPNPLDGLERIFLFYYHFGISSDGYFWSFDQFPDGSQAFASNECDVVYLATDNGDPGGDYMLAVAAHEFEHMIHFNQDFNEVAWVDEGLGELAMWLFGNPDNISGFNSQPDNSLLVWNSQWADYIKTYLWSLYIYEQYGGQPTIYALTHNPANSLTGYQTTLDGQGYMVGTTDIFGDWSVANFLDDTTVPDGQFGYAGDELPPFNAFRTHTTFPADGNGSTQAYATDYIRLRDFEAAPTLIFNGFENRDYRVSMLALDPELPTLVASVDLDEGNDGSLSFSEAVDYFEVIIAVANVHPTQSAVYSYEVTASPTAVLPALPGRPDLSCHPNPFNPRTEFSFELAQGEDVQLTVHDARGREVARLVDGALPAGLHQVPWSALRLPAGIYLGRLTLAGTTAAVTKVTIVK